MNKFSITAIERDQGCCSKTYILENGELIKKSPGGVPSGVGEVLSFNSIEYFHRYMKNCNDKGERWKCFLAAEPIGKQANDKFKVLSKKNKTPTSISLSKDCFPVFTPNKSILLLDYDPNQGPDGEVDWVPIAMYLATLAKVTPELNWNVDHIHRYSSSAGIEWEDKEGNVHKIKKYPGTHFYLIVNSGSRIVELIQILYYRLILADIFWVEPTGAGKGKVGTLVDTQAFSSYTPLLPVGAKLIDKDGNGKISVAKKYTEINLIKGEHKVLDIDNLKTLTADELKSAETKIKKAKKIFEATDESKKLVAKHKLEHRAHYDKQGGNKLKYKRSTDTLIDHQEISDIHPVWFDNFDEPVTAAQLAGPSGAKYDGETLSDPLDILRAEPGKAKFYYNGGKHPKINCFKRDGEIIRVFEKERISSNEQMNRDHAIVMDSNKVNIVAFDGKVFQYLNETSLKLWYGAEKAVTKEGSWIEITDAFFNKELAESITSYVADDKVHKSVPKEKQIFIEPDEQFSDVLESVIIKKYDKDSIGRVYKQYGSGILLAGIINPFSDSEELINTEKLKILEAIKSKEQRFNEIYLYDVHDHVFRKLL
mgnify:CR=1 FL=1